MAVYFCFQGYQDTEPVELKLNCTNLSLTPGYSTSFEELTDSAPTAGAITDRRLNALEGTCMNI